MLLKMLYRIWLLFLLFCCINCTLAENPDSLIEQKNVLLPVPIFNRTPETGFMYGVSGLYTFYLQPYRLASDVTRPSFLFATAIYTQRKQFIGDIYLNLWTKNNDIHWVGDLSYTRFNYQYYGVGNATRLADKVRLDQNRLLLNSYIEKRIYQYIYTGRKKCDYEEFQKVGHLTLVR